jgi:hypothetical protein
MNACIRTGSSVRFNIASSEPPARLIDPTRAGPVISCDLFIAAAFAN